MKINERGKIFAIGDIHGCYEKLYRLMERLPYDPQRDTLVFLGDYIDRGPRSRDVMTYLCQLRK
jgi:serine/threonine protein phosphatase 1